MVDLNAQIEVACEAWWNSSLLPGQYTWSQLREKEDCRLPEWRSQIRAALEAAGIITLLAEVDVAAALAAFQRRQAEIHCAKIAELDGEVERLLAALPDTELLERAAHWLVARCRRPHPRGTRGGQWIAAGARVSIPSISIITAIGMQHADAKRGNCGIILRLHIVRDANES